MDLLRRHPFFATIVFVIVVIMGGMILVVTHSPVAPSQNSLTWGSGALVPTYQSTQPQQSPQQIAQQVIQGPAPTILSLPSAATVTETSGSSSAPTSNSIDYVALLGQLSGNTSVSGSVSPSQRTANTAITQAYQFIPTGMIATTAPAQKPLTADQKTLYDYGNEVGGEIQSFEELNSNQPQILKDQAEDRSNPVKIAAVVSLGQRLASVGTYMQQMQEVPPSINDDHNALAQSYIDIGAKLQLVAQAQSDAGFVQALQNYDTSANTFVRNYAALAQFFSEHGVTFGQHDPGSVFSFTETSGVGAGGL